MWSEICKTASSGDTPNCTHSQDSLVIFFASVSSHTTKIKLPRPVKLFKKHTRCLLSTPVHFCFWLQAICLCCLSRSASLWDNYSGSTRTNCLLQKSASPSWRQCHSVNVRPIFSQRRQQLFFSRRLIAADFQWCWPEYVHIQCFSPPSPRFPRCSLAGKKEVKNAEFANKNAIF